MKNIKNIFRSFFIASAIMISIIGCSKLEEVPLSFIAPENYYTTVPQCETILGAAMARLYGEWNDQSFGYPIDYFKRDDVFLGAYGNIPSEYGQKIWGSMWGAIVNCNTLIKSINNGSVKGASDSDKTKLIAQAKFIRSWNYFNLVRFWGGVPIYNELNESGVLNNLPRASIAEVYAQIISDFTYAAVNLPSREEWGTSKLGRPTNAAAHGLLAKVYLTMATNPLNLTEYYAKAKDEAKILIDNPSITLITKVEDVFLRVNKYAPEMLWSLNANSVDPMGHPQIWDSNKGWGDMAIEPRMDSIWPEQPRKMAYLRTVNEDGENYKVWSGTSAPFVRKFCDTYVTADEYASGKAYTNMPVIRFAEVLLIYAEASNMASASGTAPQDACDAINRVIDRANGGDITFNTTSLVNSNTSARTNTAMTKAEFDDRVILERQYELIGEYDRIHDQNRKRLLNNTKCIPVYWGYSYKSSDYLWPIPILDLQQNPLFVQNDGYPSTK